jgi:hypothetical protein
MFFALLSGWLVIGNVSANRNGFVTAGLIGGVPVHAGRRSVVAECLGLVSYMPQSGLLFPVVLTLDGRRRHDRGDRRRCGSWRDGAVGFWKRELARFLRVDAGDRHGPPRRRPPASPATAASCWCSFLAMPIGFAATVVVTAVIARRTVAGHRLPVPAAHRKAAVAS